MSEESKSKGMAKAEQSLDPDWAIEAESALGQIILSQKYYTVDDIWNTGLSKPKMLSHIGIIMQRAAKENVARKVGTGIMSTRGNHKDIAVWESLYCQTDNLGCIDLVKSLKPIDQANFTMEEIANLVADILKAK